LTSDCDSTSWLDSLCLEPMQPEDLDSVLAVERLSFPSVWSRESYLRELRNRNSYYIVARLEGEIIGHAGMWVVLDEAHISTLAVHPARRRRKLGRFLLAHLIQIAEQKGAAHITLEVREGNLPALRLYEQFGFQSRGRLPHYYGDTGENALVMCKTLASGDYGERTD
jgi:ribosomal-protein-alanine N-acetyltransferase